MRYLRPRSMIGHNACMQLKLSGLLCILCSVPGVCNAYLPEDSTLNRFMWTVDYFASQGFYIILDNQFNLDQTATQDTQKWLNRVRSALLNLLSSEAESLLYKAGVQEVSVCMQLSGHSSTAVMQYTQ